jgi:hypothetical protein
MADRQEREQKIPSDSRNNLGVHGAPTFDFATVFFRLVDYKAVVVPKLRHGPRGASELHKSSSAWFLSSPDNHRRNIETGALFRFGFGRSLPKRITGDRSGMMRLPTAHKLHEHPCE